MELSVVKGSLQYLEACAEALFDSEIGAVYFSPKERALAFLLCAVREGKNDGNISHISVYPTETPTISGIIRARHALMVRTALILTILPDTN